MGFRKSSLFPDMRLRGQAIGTDLKAGRLALGNETGVVPTSQESSSKILCSMVIHCLEIATSVNPKTRQELGAPNLHDFCHLRLRLPPRIPQIARCRRQDNAMRPRFSTASSTAIELSTAGGH